MSLDAEIHSSAELGFDRSDISPESLEVVRTLKSRGYDGFLVGGCVRDLIMGLKPKDFDVATDALPGEVQDIFPRSRIIGRRFKIVHVVSRRGRFRHVVEVTTYRAASENPDGAKGRTFSRSSRTGRILADNVYGTREEDVMRRDFTLNALYYDPLKEKVIDYLGGVRDIRHRQLRMIGDPERRFAEDPVRMIRAVRFQARLGFEVQDEIESAIRNRFRCLEDIHTSRLYDEVIKLFHQGSAEEAWDRLFETPLGKMLFPHVASSMRHGQPDSCLEFVRGALRNTDNRVRAGMPVIDSFFVAVVFWDVYRKALGRQRAGRTAKHEAHGRAVLETLDDSSGLVIIPLRVRTIVQEIWWMQDLMERRPKKSIDSIMANRRFRAAYDFLVLRAEAGEIDRASPDWWTRLQEVTPDQRRSMIDSLPGAKKKRRRRRAGGARPQSSPAHNQGAA